MSCYEWESGTISIPRAEWAGFKAVIRDAHNIEQRRRLALAERLQAALVKDATGQRNVDWRRLSQKVLDELKLADDDRWDIVHALFQANRAKAEAANGGRFADPLDLKGSAGRPPKPTKGMFPEANGKTMTFDVRGGGISLDDTARTVHWQVHENNHAIERARSHPVAQALFRALDTMKWDTKCGGEIVGNDEYNRDDSSAGGGGNTVNARYGRDRKDWEKSMGIRTIPSRSDGRRYTVNNFYRY
jgi:hypothetical protein